eukprot:COSAG02_NODE_9_length_59728_cov_36.104714_65_plen_151_part_00
MVTVAVAVVGAAVAVAAAAATDADRSSHHRPQSSRVQADMATHVLSAQPAPSTFGERPARTRLYTQRRSRCNLHLGPIPKKLGPCHVALAPAPAPAPTVPGPHRRLAPMTNCSICRQPVAVTAAVEEEEEEAAEEAAAVDAATSPPLPPP